jgi:hypothetical protein
LHIELARFVQFGTVFLLLGGDGNAVDLSASVQQVKIHQATLLQLAARVDGILRYRVHNGAG